MLKILCISWDVMKKLSSYQSVQITDCMKIQDSKEAY